MRQADAVGARARPNVVTTTRTSLGRHHILGRLGAVVAVIVLGGCTPWLGLRSVWGDQVRTIADAPRSQATIDAGEVDNWSGCWPGDGCTIHLAAHRTSHGGTFRDLPAVQPGDLVELGYQGTTYQYRVTSIEVHQHSSRSAAVIHGDLVLQTTHPERGYVYLVYASLVS